VLDDIVPMRGHSQGLVFGWQKERDLLIVSGNSEVIKIWDVTKEIHFQDIPTDSFYCLTSLAVDNNDSNMVVAGYANGELKLYDIRTSNKAASDANLAFEHKSWIVSSHFPKFMDKQMFSASNSGEVKHWDLRKLGSSVKTIVAHDKPAVSSFSVHNYAPIFAIGTQDQRIRIMNFNGDEVSLIRYHDGFLGQRIGPISDLSFHKYKLRLAAGATDSIVSIYTGETSKDQLFTVSNTSEFEF